MTGNSYADVDANIAFDVTNVNAVGSGMQLYYVDSNYLFTQTYATTTVD